MRATELVAQRVMAQLAPPPELTVSEWADRERRLPRESSAEPGQWRTDRAPYQRGIMDAVHDPLVETVVTMKSAQVGLTEILLNILGYHIAVDPCPILMLEPTLDLARAISNDRLAPMLRDTPALQGKVRDTRKKDTSNTILHKSFRGGHLTLAGANSTASLASRPIRLLLADEVDRYPLEVGEEGDPLSLGIKRTATFWNRRVLITSTPTVKGGSRIERWYEQSDQRRFFVPCPRCGEFHTLEWSNVKFEDRDPATAHLVCPACFERIEDLERAAMVRAGEWRATAPFRGVAGFFIWEAYSPWSSLSKIVADFLDAREKGTEELRVWVNTCLGQSWEERGEQTPAHVLIARREAYAAEVPAGACCLTMGVDVQDDRLEAFVYGWGQGEESWLIDAHRLPGDTSRAEPWAMLDELLAATYLHACGARLPILATCVDTAGHRTDYAYDFVRRHAHQRVYAIIGRDGQRPIVSAPSEKTTGRNPRPVALYTVGVDAVKALIFSRLRVTEPGPGFVHFPADHAQVTEEFFEQLTSEKLVKRFKSGLAVHVWVQTRPRNEALDGTVYAIAALRLLNPRLAEMAKRLAGISPPPPDPAPQSGAENRKPGAVELSAPPPEPPATPPPTLAKPSPPPPKRRRVWRSSYLHR